VTITAPGWLDDQTLPCRGRTRLFFAPDHERPEARMVREAAAKQICARCPHIVACAEFGADHPGIYGGMTVTERLVRRGTDGHIPGRTISSSTYRNYGCRCNGCTAAEAAARSLQRERERGRPYRRHQRRSL
jgi:hypothetical protein